MSTMAKAESKGPAKSVADEYGPSDTLLIYSNPDKIGTGGKSGKGRYMPKFPFRALMCGPPGCGKRNTTLNLIMRLDPPPTSIHIIHIDPETTEWDLLKKICPVYFYTPDDPPNFAELDSYTNAEVPDYDPNRPKRPNMTGGVRERALAIIDETPTKLLSKEALKELQSIMGYGSTHKNIAVLFMYQDLTSCDPYVRRMFDFYCLWKSPDSGAMQLAATRVGVPFDELEELMSACQKKTDFITIDATRHPDDPYRFRLNLIYPANRVKK